MHRVHTFLATYGHINSGIYSRRQPTASDESVDGQKEKAPSDACDINDGSTLQETASRARKRVVVIGAGVSGLAAARQLQAFGYEVVVCEARGRVGGRIRSEVWGEGGNGSIDCGAMIVTGDPYALDP